MKDLTEFITVEDLAKKEKASKLWLCPTIVRNAGFNRPSYLGGLDCTVSTIPEEIRTKQATRCFYENKVLCIIWKHQ